MIRRNVSPLPGFVIASACLAGALSACSMSNIPRPDFVGATHVAHERADDVSATADEKMPGVSDAVKAPLRDLNLLDDDIPIILVRAYQHPYDTGGLTSCAAILDQVAALDLALGPDVDIPRAGNDHDDMFAKGKGLAGDAALDAVRSATTGVIPVRSWVRRLSGAARAEQEVKAVVLAGAVRRGFLKAEGLQLHCDWPAAPLDLKKAALRARALNSAEKTALGGAPAADPPAVSRR
jgi:hypothetical protein